MIMKKILLLTTMLVACTLLQAQEGRLQMPQFFADGMVLQRDVKIPVWGKSMAGEEIAVSLNGKTAKTKVKADGSWKVYLPKMKAGGPYTLEVLAAYGLGFRLPADIAGIDFGNSMLGIGTEADATRAAAAQVVEAAAAARIALPDHLIPGEWGGPQDESFENYREYLYAL